MTKTNSLAKKYIEDISSAIVSSQNPAAIHHYQMLRLMAKQRLELIKPYIIEKHGLNVGSGPFAGMKFLPRSADGCYIPKLMGFYEAELHTVWQQLRARRRYDAIIDVGAAEGYYVVGLARMFPEAQVHAYETNVSCHELIQMLAEQNQVADRVHMHGECTHAELESYAGKAVLLVCDIEGAETALLDPLLAHALNHMDIVVELHEVLDKTIPEVMINRFRSSHSIQIIHEQTPRSIKLPQYCERMDRLDQMLCIWEHRGGPTPWAFMQAKSFPTITVSYD